MARIVTRVTSKNFCIVKPSFDLEQATDLEGNPMLKVDKGQACINGMDLIINQSNRIYPPDEAGDYYLALHLWRDSSSNVLGDLVIGVTKQFKGVYLDWWNERVEDVDCLWLGKVHWDGTSFTSIEEDPEKYGRIWAKDILCKLEDWKHPDDTGMILQDWIYKVPDWYLSKEGDVIFGPIEFLAGRDPDVEGTFDDHEDLGTGKYGARIGAIDEDNSEFMLKAPSVSADNTSKVIYLKATDTGINGRVGNAILNCSANNNYNWMLNAMGRLELNGTQGVTLSSGVNKTDCKLTLDDNIAELSDSTCTKGTVKYTFATNSITEKFGNGITNVTDGSSLETTVAGNIIVNAGGNNVTFNSNNFHVNGEITANKVWNAVYNGFGEIFRKDKTENIEYGDLVCVRADGLVYKVTTQEDIKTIVGICSDTVGIGLGGNTIPEDERVEVEMVGQVWVKTNKELEAGKMVKALADGTVDITENIVERIGITLTNTQNGKVRIVYNGI